MSHRVGWRDRPECHGGMKVIWTPDDDSPPPPIISVRPPSIEQESPRETSPKDSTPDTSSVPDTPHTPDTLDADTLDIQEEGKEIDFAAPFEYRGDETIVVVPPVDDPEEIAAYFNQLRRQGQPDSGGERGGNGNGLSATFPPLFPPSDGEFEVEPPELPPQLQTVKQSVELYPVILVYYAYFKEHGWWAGRGTISDFVMDVLLHHFHDCMGLGVFVMRREEVGLDTEEGIVSEGVDRESPGQ